MKIVMKDVHGKMVPVKVYGEGRRTGASDTSRYIKDTRARADDLAAADHKSRSKQWARKKGRVTAEKSICQPPVLKKKLAKRVDSPT
jgi:hypothetical protein